MDNQLPAGVAPLPTAAESRPNALNRLTATLHDDELTWLVEERFNDQEATWYLGVVRMGANGRWMRQRYRFDAQSQTLYYLGERALSDAEFRDARSTGAKLR